MNAINDLEDLEVGGESLASLRPASSLKLNNMTTYIIYPEHKTLKLTAPSFTIDVEKEKDVENEARRKSGLGKFKNWVFNYHTAKK